MAKISKPVVFDERQARTRAQLGRYGTDVAIWGRWFLSGCDFKRLRAVRRSSATTSAFRARQQPSSRRRQVSTTACGKSPCRPLDVASRSFWSPAHSTAYRPIIQTSRSATSMPWESRCARNFNAATAASFNQRYASAPDLKSILCARMRRIVLQHRVIPGSCHVKAQGIISSNA